MGTLTLLLIALGLSMDAFAVSISNGMCYGGFGKKEAVFSSFTFGFFQMLMPIVGYLAGRTFSDAISAADHWIALILLGAIGAKMVIDGVRDLKNPESCDISRPFTPRVLTLQAIATSIDALAVGISFALMSVNIFAAAAFIGVTTFVCCVLGSLLGRRFGLLLGHRAEIFGGLLLVAIGVKIFVEHMFG